MNIWQVAMQARYLLRAATWSGASASLFYPSSVLVTPGQDPETIAARIVPVMEFRGTGGDSDPEFGDEPSYERRIMTGRLYVAHADEVGEAAILGAHRSGGLADSKGRGILEMETEVKRILNKLGDSSGIRMSFAGDGDSGMFQDANRKWVAWQDYRWVVYCCAQRFYHPCRKFAATGGVGSASLTWALPPTRFDFYLPRITRKAGSTAPTSPTDGTELTGLTASSVAKTDSVAAGTYSYSLWASYDDMASPPATNRSLSRLLSVTGVVVS